uniref:uroporphyrinogen-III C-methyltransferase n=1 Tax=Oryza meridionalis TaxID=40149 RepID=A0A0E0C503_9ORYZ
MSGSHAQRAPQPRAALPLGFRYLLAPNNTTENPLLCRSGRRHFSIQPSPSLLVLGLFLPPFPPPLRASKTAPPDVDEPLRSASALLLLLVLLLPAAPSPLLYVGKTAGYHSRTQEEIHELLLSFAEAGANVVRLKGGDPLVFGRGGEEMDFLQQQGIRVEVIPGITSASGIAAELGIPLTHRGVATSVRFLTGHSRNGGPDPLYVAENAADPDTTLVVYMGLSTLPSLAPKLMKHGLPPDTPAVAVERGTTPQQRMVFAMLKDLVNEVKSEDLVSPTLIIIGKVVALSPFWIDSSKQGAQSIENLYAAETKR